MTLERTLDGDYGGEIADASVMRDPSTQNPSARFNRLREDAAHMSRTSIKAMLRFTATATAAVTTVEPDYWWTQWGGGVGFKPTITKTATGLYTVAFASTYDDDLGVTETLDFKDALIEAFTSSSADHVLGGKAAAVGSSSVFVYLKEFTGGAFVLDDVTVGARAIQCSVWIR